MGLVERIRSDAIYLAATVRLFRRLIPLLTNRESTVPDMIEERARRFADRPALILDTQELTYRELDEGANRYARWARSVGVGKGDVVGLLMPNRPEQVVAWIGIARAGGIAALLNPEQVGASLAHSISIVAPRHLIVDSELAGTLESARAELGELPPASAAGAPVAGAKDLDAALAAQSPAPLAGRERPALAAADPCLYVYTSGTTGKPKAARITHHRALTAMHAFASGMRTTSGDRVFVPLPLCHSTATLAGVGAALSVGAAVILKRRFSASEFWRDCTRHGATMLIYIGELCRYLVNTPPCPEERRHKLRVACGNGLRVDVWRAFDERFRVPRIIEFYGSTEGNVAFGNHDSRIGSIGRIPFWMRPISNVAIVRFDLGTEMPVRDARGRCIRCAPDEVGEAIGRIENKPLKPIGRFDGYTDARATERKILHDVFAPGDRWFRTGDLMRQDADGYFYFVDRIGDTFRWKGENVATFEVADAISHFEGVQDVNVYGVEIPGHEGRAGMAIIVAAGATLDLTSLAAHVAKSLPSYARPVILRLTDRIETTSTMKHIKTTLVREGFDPSAIADALYYADPATGAFMPLDQEAYARISEGKIRF